MKGVKQNNRNPISFPNRVYIVKTFNLFTVKIVWLWTKAGSVIYKKWIRKAIGQYSTLCKSRIFRKSVPKRMSRYETVTSIFIKRKRKRRWNTSRNEKRLTSFTMRLSKGSETLTKPRTLSLSKRTVPGRKYLIWNVSLAVSYTKLIYLTVRSVFLSQPWLLTIHRKLWPLR